MLRKPLIAGAALIAGYALLSIPSRQADSQAGVLSPNVNLSAVVTRTDAAGTTTGREYYQVQLSSTLYNGRVYYNYRGSFQDSAWKSLTSYRVISINKTGNRIVITAAAQYASPSDKVVWDITADPLTPSRSTIHMTVRDYYGRLLTDRSTGPSATLDAKSVVTVL